MRDETSQTWLQQLKGSPETTSGWAHLVDSYVPFIKSHLVRQGLDHASADDVAQHVLTIVWKKLPEFERHRKGSFRSWLRAITVNCFRDFLKTRQHRSRAVGGTNMIDLAASMEDPHGEFAANWNREHARHLVAQLLKAMEPEFPPKSLEIFKRLAVDEEKVATVAEDLGMTKNAVVITRSRVLKRLRSVAEQLFPDERQLFSHTEN